jgi:hypothetical protein
MTLMSSTSTPVAGSNPRFKELHPLADLVILLSWPDQESSFSEAKATKTKFSTTYTLWTLSP